MLFTTPDLERYISDAALCQELGMVPIVEPEVLMDGDHSLEQSFEVTEATLDRVFTALRAQRVVLEQMLLKPNMVLPGAGSPRQATVLEVAEATVGCLRRAVPDAERAAVATQLLLRTRVAGASAGGVAR